MKKSYYVFLSVLIFLIISPFFNGVFVYLFLNFGISNAFAGAENFSFLIFIAYIVTFIPAFFVGLSYGLLSPARKKSMLRWLVPTLGCVIYLLYIVISQMLFTLFRAEATEMTLTLALLSIGGSFFSTIIANISLKDKIVERAIQTK